MNQSTSPPLLNSTFRSSYPSRYFDDEASNTEYHRISQLCMLVFHGVSWCFYVLKDGITQLSNCLGRRPSIPTNSLELELDRRERPRTIRRAASCAPKKRRLFRDHPEQQHVYNTLPFFLVRLSARLFCFLFRFCGNNSLQHMRP